MILTVVHFSASLLRNRILQSQSPSSSQSSTRFPSWRRNLSLFSIVTSSSNTSNTSSTQDEESNTEVVASNERTPFNLTGISCGDKFQCFVPNRELDTQGGIAFPGPSSHQMLLKWSSGPNKVLFLCKPDQDVHEALLTALQSSLFTARSILIFVEDEVINYLQQSNVTLPLNIQRISPESMNSLDLVIAFGGDGLLMHANTLFKRGAPPVMCFDFGSLGFLAPFYFDDYEEALQQVLDGSALLTLRMRLQCSIIRNNSIIGMMMTSISLKPF